MTPYRTDLPFFRPGQLVRAGGNPFSGTAAWPPGAFAKAILDGRVIVPTGTLCIVLEDVGYYTSVLACGRPLEIYRGHLEVVE